MDVMVYSLVLPTLLAEWHISKGQAGLLSTATLLLSSLGGWLAGILADRVGRVRVLKLTIFWFAFFTFLSGFTQNFEQLLVVRGLQGLGFGGEWAVGAALMGESIRSSLSRPCRGYCSGGVVYWLGPQRHSVYHSLLSASACNRLAGYVLDRHPTRPAHRLHSQQG